MLTLCKVLLYEGHVILRGRSGLVSSGREVGLEMFCRTESEEESEMMSEMTPLTILV